jgi:RNA polymerase sigma factor (sigma-70 family)
MSAIDFREPPYESMSTDSSIFERGPHGNPERFVERYRKLIVAWATHLVRQLGVPIDPEDVAHAVILRFLSRAVWTFKPGPAQFRTYLFTTVRNAVLLELRKHRVRADCGGLGDAIEAVPESSIEEAIDSLDTQWRLDTRRVREAIDRIRHRVAPLTWQAFELKYVRGKTGSEVAARLGLSGAGAVHNARIRVLKLLREETLELGLNNWEFQRLVAHVLLPPESPASPSPNQA